MRRTSRSESVRARVDAAPAYELVLAMSVLAAGEDTEIARSLRGAAPDLADEIVAFAPSDWMWAHLVTLVADAPAPRDVAAFLAYLEGVPAREILRRLVGYYVRWFRGMTPPDVMDRAIVGDASAARAFLRTSQPDDPAWQAALRARLDAGGARTKQELLRLVEGFHDRAFAPVLAASRRTLVAAVNLRRRGLRASRVGEVLAAFTAWDYVPEAGITRVLIVPSLVIGGSLHEFEHEQTKIVCVPVTGPAPARAPASMLRPVRALADESRLRIVLALAERDHGAQELADRTGLGLTTVLHHLASLREARLVSGGGRRRAYQLRRGEIERVAERIRGLAR